MAPLYQYIGGIFMISLSNTTAQTIAAGQSLTFNTVLLKTRSRAECFRKNTGSIKLCASCAIYEVSFSGNISGAAAGTPVQLALALGGDILPETTMIATPSAANAANNVGVTTLVNNNCCDYDRVTIVNTGTTDVTVAANPIFFVKRVA